LSSGQEPARVVWFEWAALGGPSHDAPGTVAGAAGELARQRPSELRQHQVLRWTLIAMGKRNPLRIKVLSKVAEVRTMMVSSRVVMRLRGA
jgi:hypothetical protein